jgi:hypothetical protein
LLFSTRFCFSTRLGAKPLADFGLEHEKHERTVSPLARQALDNGRPG